MDLMHNRHKLEMEREQAQEYRKKFYSSGAGGFQGAGGGSFSNSGGAPGYSVPSSYTPSSYNAPGGSGSTGDGVSRVYTPYNPNEDPVLKVSGSSSGLKWGASGPESSSSSNVVSSGQGGSTYNITNNNNINYNYGSNITAISSDGSGSVPTFHDVEKAKKEAAANQSYAASALGYLGSGAGAVASGLGKNIPGAGRSLNTVAQTLQSSKGLAQVSDSIKRNTGLDIHKALGGKTAVELAEERLKKEQTDARGGYGGGYGGYQGISIPLTPAAGSSSTQNNQVTGQGEKLNVGSSSKYGQQWGPSSQQEEAPKEVAPTQKLFQAPVPTGTKKRLDDDSDDEDDKPQKVEAPKAPPKKEADLLDLNASEPPKDLLTDLGGSSSTQQQSNLLDMGVSMNQSENSMQLLGMGQPAATNQDLLQST